MARQNRKHKSIQSDTNKDHLEYITSRIDEAQGQLCDLNDEEPVIDVHEMQKNELVYIMEQIIPFFVTGQAVINAEKRSITGNYQKARAELETKGKSIIYT